MSQEPEADYYDRTMMQCDGCCRLPYQGVMDGTASEVEENRWVKHEGQQLLLCAVCARELEEKPELWSGPDTVVCPTGVP